MNDLDRRIADVKATSNPQQPLVGPSKFWEHLSEEHRADLDDFGFSYFKRLQAMKYFTWRWCWHSIWRSEQFRFLLMRTSPAAFFRTIFTPANVEAKPWRFMDLPRPDRWLYVFCTRLLWQYSERHDDHGLLQYQEPDLGQPPPVYLGDRLISQDQANSALEVNAMLEAGILGSDRDSRRHLRILEIGAGYGRTAFILLKHYPKASYTIIDIEPALSISRHYLTTLFHGRDLVFVDAADPKAVAVVANGSPFEIGLSISSLQEMTPAQVCDYLHLMGSACKSVYLKQWSKWRNPRDGITFEFDTMPIPRGWRQIFKGKCPVQTKFTQAAWTI